MSRPASSSANPTRQVWPFRIKICGITNLADAMMAEAAGADALGFNFYPRSMRCTTAAQVTEIKTQLSDKMQSIGVFVNQDAALIQQLASELRLDAVQLHGDETPEIMDLLHDCRVIRCIRPPTESAPLDHWLNHCQSWIAAGAQAILIDAPPPVRRADSDSNPADAFGGTGQSTNWTFAAELAQQLTVPLILAGGLNPSNVADAIHTVNPAAVDVASGVESFPGKKNSTQLESFVSRAHQAFHDQVGN